MTGSYQKATSAKYVPVPAHSNLRCSHELPDILPTTRATTGAQPTTSPQMASIVSTDGDIAEEIRRLHLQILVDVTRSEKDTHAEELGHAEKRLAPISTSWR
ncbi:hypothetical protein LTR64_008770 [Lithohypha guttulata]|uniref:uncharacterized protein n=1 Tax=Lithohypha guttulata TaxID=1690604 RepID=UPI00315D7B3C